MFVVQRVMCMSTESVYSFYVKIFFFNVINSLKTLHFQTRDQQQQNFQMGDILDVLIGNRNILHVKL